MTSKLSQLLQNLLAAPYKDVADPQALERECQVAFNKGVVEAIGRMDDDIAAMSRRLATINGPTAATTEPGVQTSAVTEESAAAGDPADASINLMLTDTDPVTTLEPVAND